MAAAKGLKIHEIPYSEAQRIYEEQAKDKLPLTEAEFREVISAETMVFGRKGLGGPQPQDIARSIFNAKTAMHLAKDHVAFQTSSLKTSRTKLSEFFSLIQLISRGNFHENFKNKS